MPADEATEIGVSGVKACFALRYPDLLEERAGSIERHGGTWIDFIIGKI